MLFHLSHGFILQMQSGLHLQQIQILGYAIDSNYESVKCLKTKAIILYNVNRDYCSIFNNIFLSESKKPKIDKLLVLFLGKFYQILTFSYVKLIVKAAKLMSRSARLMFRTVNDSIAFPIIVGELSVQDLVNIETSRKDLLAKIDWILDDCLNLLMYCEIAVDDWSDCVNSLIRFTDR